MLKQNQNGGLVFKSILFFLLLFSSLTVYAAIERATSKPKYSKLEQELIETDISISEWFDSQAEGVDIFIARKKLTRRRNESQFKVNLSNYLDDKGNFVNSYNAGFRLHLPNVEEYWNLKFTTYDESKIRGVKKTEPIKKPQRDNYGASVGLFQKLGDVRTSFQPRVELQNPLRISHSLAFESLAEFKVYHVNPKLEFFANPDQGIGVFQAININWKISHTLAVTFINEGEYYDRDALYEVKNGISFGQIINSKSGISYTLMFDSNSRPSYHLEAYTLSIGWSQTIYKNILNYSITPLLGFGKSNHFTGIPGMGTGIEVLF